MPDWLWHFLVQLVPGTQFTGNMAGFEVVMLAEGIIVLALVLRLTRPS